MKIGALIQARMNSSRLPEKVLLPLAGKPVIQWLVDRVQQVKSLDTLLVVTGPQTLNQKLVDYCENQSIPFFCGPEDDVLERFWQAASDNHLDIVVRLTSDCPFMDPELIELCLNKFTAANVDYLSNTHPPTFPDGYDIEIFSFKALAQSHREARLSFEREHVTPYIWQNKAKFSQDTVRYTEDLSHLRLTLDEKKDFDCLELIATKFSDQYFGFTEICKLYKENPSLFDLNASITRNDGFMKSITGELYRPNHKNYSLSNQLSEKVSARIPSGAQTFSKCPTQYIAGCSPGFLKSAQGIMLEDLDGNHFIDTIMGLGPVTLGHANREVDEAVSQQLKKGIAFSLPTALEVELAEILCDLIPCAEMARFGKNGSDVTSAAVRAARAVTGRDVIACCGYHGWQDWFIGTTTRNLGIPESVQNLTQAFEYNNIGSLKKIFDEHEVAGVIMEPLGVMSPENDFLKEVRELCTQQGVLLIFDEIITGFRFDLKGAQSVFQVTPDLACFGKALGNGYPVSALVGKKDIMNIFNEVFFSFTAGGEGSGLAAAIKTLEIYQRDDVVKKLWANGQEFQQALDQAIQNAGLENIMIQKGYPSRSVLEFISGQGEATDLKLKSLFQQEMIKRDILTISAHFISLGHEGDVIQKIAQAANESCQILKVALENDCVDRLLEGPPVSPVFRKA